MYVPRFSDAPHRITALPLEERGFPIPWFVPWFDGKPDFRAVKPERIQEAERRKLCWICGHRLGTAFAFVIGPMCAVNRVSAEPPSHLPCARFAVKACPFLSQPLAKRAEVTEHHLPPAGLMIERNPGVILIWRTQSYRAERERDGRMLFKIGAPTGLEWYSRGREATRDEVIESIETGLPALKNVAAMDGRAGLEALADQVARAVKLIPA